MFIKGGSDRSPKFKVFNMIQSNKDTFNYDKVEVHQYKENDTRGKVKFRNDGFATIPGEELLNGVAHLFKNCYKVKFIKYSYLSSNSNMEK
jgi:hypothetical protein